MAFFDRTNGYTGDVAVKIPCRCATTANITLSGFQVIDGVTLADGDENLRVLVKDQTDQTENGIWNANANAWTRAADFDGENDVVKGTTVGVQEGSIQGGYFYQIATSDPITIGTTSITFTESQSAFGSATAAAASAVQAALSETNAATSASNALTSETNAATSETNAATSETNASNSASAASTSETNAATSESNAAISASAAATSETNAAISEANANISEANSLAHLQTQLALQLTLPNAEFSLTLDADMGAVSITGNPFSIENLPDRRVDLSQGTGTFDLNI